MQFVATGAFNGEMTLYAGKSEIMNVSGSGNNTAGRAFLLPGSYTLVMEPLKNSSGAYTLNSILIADNANCAMQSFAMRGVQISGSIGGSDCTNLSPNERVDNFLVRANAGQNIVVTGSIGRPGSFAIMAPLGGNPVAIQTVTAQGGGNIAFSYTPTVSGYYTVFVSGIPVPTVYSLTIQ